jgi:ATP-dependent Clp protease protease subunit
VSASSWAGGRSDDWRHDIQARLFDQRIVMVSGPLDDQRATDAAAQLMTLDATGDEPAHLHLDCADGLLGAALSLMDVIDLLGVEVHATCRGQAVGPSLGVLAVAHRRLAAPHARLGLFEPSESFRGRATDLERSARRHQEEWRAFCARVAEACNREVREIEHDAATGRYFNATEALEYGLLDEILVPGVAEPSGPRPLGFA